MKRSTLLLQAALIAVCACFASTLLDRAGVRVEAARTALSRVSPQLREQMSSIDRDLELTWYTSPRASWTADLRALAPALEAFLADARTIGLRVHASSFEVADTPEQRRWLAAAGVVPRRARRVEGEGWREVEIVSTLRVSLGARGAALVPIESRADVEGLSERLVAIVDELEHATPPSFVLSAPPGARKLRTLLESLGDVADVDFDDDARIPDCDLFVWLDPRAAEPRQLEALRTHLARGGSALVAGGAWRATPEPGEVRFERTELPVDALWQAFGLRTRQGPVLDARGSAAWNVRAPATSQDFRAFAAQPNGALEFAAPTTFEPDALRLDELGLGATSLAATSDRAYELAPRAAAYATAELLPSRDTRFLGRQALLVALAPRSGRGGTLVASASSSLFLDADFALEGTVHAELVRVLAGTLASSERRAARRAGLAVEPLARELDRGERWTARALVVLLVPLLLGLAALRGSAARLARFARPAALVTGTIVVLGALSSLVPFACDTTRDERNTLLPRTLDVAREAASEPLSIDVAFSGGADLPPELRGVESRARALVREIARRVDGIEVRDVDVEARAAELERVGVTPVRAASEDDEERVVHRAYAHLVLERGDRREVLVCADPRAVENLEFRLASAFERLAGAPRARVALHADAPRLTPAEALLAYERKGLFAPTEGDVYARARSWLEAHEIEVVPLDTARPTIEPGALALLLQPRRDATALVRELARHLDAGGKAVVCAQMFEPRSRQRRASDMAVRLWPEPQFPDVDRLWLPRLGVQLDGELVLDAASGSLELVGTREDADGRERAVRSIVSSPLIVRTSATGIADDPLVRGLGDLVWPSPSRIVLDRARLASLGLTARPLVWTSTRAWTHPWKGGELADDVVRVDPRRTGERQLLAVALEGPFPGASLDPELARAGSRSGDGADDTSEPRAADATSDTSGSLDAHAAGGALDSPAPSPDARGELVLVGGSSLFENEHLFLEGSDHAQLLLRLVAGATSPAATAALLARRASEPSFEPVEGSERALGRAFVILAGPLVVLALALGLRRAWRPLA